MFFMLGLPLKPTTDFFSPMISSMALSWGWHDLDLPTTQGCWNDWRIYELCCFPQAIASEVRGDGVGLGGPR